MNSRLTKRFIIAFSLVIMIVFGIMMAHELKRSDFPAHIGWAREYSTSGYINGIPHTLFAKLVVIIRALLPANVLVRISGFAKQVYDLKSFEISAWIVMVLSYLATALILVKRMVKDWPERREKNNQWVAGIAALIILLVGPIFLFTISNRRYLGYITPNPYHNPTYILLRPFAVLIYFFIIDNLFARWSWSQSFIMVVLIVCASLAKPNFTITIIPAVGILILVFYMKKLKEINWWFVLGPVGLSSVLVLASQYFLNYSGDQGNKIIFSPLAAIRIATGLISHSPPIMFILFTLASILFPLLVAILNWKKIKNRVSFQLGWVNFLVALGYAILLTESLEIGSLNFWWGMMIAVFLLFFDSLLFWVKELFEHGFAHSLKLWQGILMGSALLTHLVCGIIFYFLILQSPKGGIL